MCTWLLAYCKVGWGGAGARGLPARPQQRVAQAQARGGLKDRPPMLTDRPPKQPDNNGSFVFNQPVGRELTRVSLIVHAWLLSREHP